MPSDHAFTAIERHVVKVGRHRSSPTVTIDIVPDRIGVGMSLPDFIAALVLEVGNPTLMVTKAQLQKNLTTAAQAICTSMKHDITPEL